MTNLSQRTRIAAGLGFATGVVVLLLRAAFVVGGDAAALAAEPAVSDPATTHALPPLEVRAFPRAEADVAQAEAEEPAEPAVTPAPETRPAWALPAGLVEPRLAFVEEGKLVQALPDGTRIELTLDPGLQRTATRTLERFRVAFGSLVAIRPDTGELLALAEYAHERPDLRHLALQAEGPAASIFKTVSAAAFLAEGGLTPESEVCTHGGLRKLSLYHLTDNPDRDTRCQTLAEAFGSSNNVAFARWADRLLTPRGLQAMAERFLFNRRLPFLWGVGVSEAEMPTGSRLGFARAAAGFEGTTLSPLHAALIAATVANDGVMMTPRLVQRAVRADRVLYEAQVAPLATVLEPDVARDLARVMVATTESGSAKKFFYKRGKARIPGVTVAGKTGHLTARDTGAARHYSWFVAFAPAEEPEIAVAGLVVNEEVWTTKGAAISRDLLQAWFDRARAVE